MATPKITIHDVATGKTVVRDFNAAELAQLELDKAQAKLDAEALVVRQAAREALLTKLGITEQEAQLLLGS
jgi:hypothetical protein